MEWIEKIVWHEVVTRPPTEEELEGFAEWGLSKDEYPVYMFDCEVPDIYCDILVLGKNGYVWQGEQGRLFQCDTSRFKERGR